MHNSQSGVIVKHDTKSSQKNQLHQPYSNIPSSMSHHPSYDSYPPPPSGNQLNNSDRYVRGMGTISTSPHHTSQQQQQQQQKQSPQPSHRQTPPSSSYNMIVVGGGNAKQKVSSPAPSHVYGKPSQESLHASAPHNRTQEVQHSSAKPLFQPQIPQMYGPPLAHTSRNVTTDPKQMYSVPPNIRPPTHSVPISGISHQLSSSPLPPPESHTSGVSPHHLDVKSFSTSPKLQQLRGGPSPGTNVPEQTQPLDLGVASSSKVRGSGNDETTGGRRKASPFPVTSLIETKKMRTEPPPPQKPLPHTTIEILQSQQQLNLVSKPMVIEYPPISVSPLDKKPKFEPMQDTSPGRITPGSKSSDSTNNTMNNNNNNISGSNSGSATPTPPSTPQQIQVNTTTTTPSNQQSIMTPEPPKSTATTTTTSSFTAPRHLKKAWLQRHTGEDTTGEDTTGVIGSGNCIKLPLKLENAAGQIKTNTLVTGNGKEEPAANNNIKEENNSVSGINPTGHFKAPN